MNDKFLAGAGLTIVAGLLLAGSATVMAGTPPNSNAYVNSVGGCLMLDRLAAPNVVGDKTHVTVASSSNISVRCQISAAESHLGASAKAVKFSGFACVANGTLTYKTAETIDDLGNVTMVCQYKKS